MRKQKVGFQSGGPFPPASLKSCAPFCTNASEKGRNPLSRLPKRCSPRPGAGQGRAPVGAVVNVRGIEWGQYPVQCWVLVSRLGSVFVGLMDICAF